MNDIADVFTQLTQVQCASCVKLWVDEESSGRDFVTTYCRDRRSRNVRGQQDGEDRRSTDRNTASHEVLHSSPYFFSNDLRKETNYHNDRVGWQKYYLSAAVIAIHGVPLHDDQDNQQYLDTVGFLCIDGKEPNVFRKEETVAFMECMADILYLPLHQLRRIKREGGGT